MKKIETSIVIEANPSHVWAVLMDFESYPQWNPFIQKISGQPEVGQYLAVQLKIENQKEMVFKPIVLEKANNFRFRWRGKLLVKGLFDGEHYFLLNDVGEGKTEFIQGENFSGLLVGMVWRKMAPGTEAGFSAMNKALKSRAEQTI